MTLDKFNAVDRQRACVYDGTNSAEINAEIADFTITSESGGTLDFTSGSGIWTAHTGWIIFYDAFGLVVDAVSPATFAQNKVRLLTTDEVVEATLEEVPEGIAAAGARTFAAIVASQTVDVDVTLTPAMADDSYTANPPVLFGGVALGDLEVMSTTPLSGSVVRVAVRNNGLLALGGSVLVTVKG